MQTIFQKPGYLEARSSVGREFFLVSDVLPTLRRADHPDDQVLCSVELFMAKDAAGTLELTVTVLHQDGAYVVLDGNKRAVAFYERRMGAGPDETALPIYLITRP